MKIGIISSGNETLTLRKVLTKYNHEYLVYHDQTFFPFGEKNLDFIVQNLLSYSTFLQSQGAEAIILDPIYELAISQRAEQTAKNLILPLFQTYLQDEVLPYSLVGKIGLLTDKWSLSQAQNIFSQTVSDYQPTPTQQATKKFQFPFNYRIKSPQARPAGIIDLWVHNPYLIKTLKNDLKYFKDANVDTVIPLHYQYFAMQRTIKSCFNHHKTRFFDLSFIEKSFKKLTTESKYSVQLRTNQSPAFLTEKKSLMRLLERGETQPITINTLPITH